MHAMAYTPGRLPAAMLAALVHLLFFVLLVYSLNWKTHAPEPVMVELWQPPQTRPIPAVTPQKTPVETVSKPVSTVPDPDIALAEKKREIAKQKAQLAELQAQQQAQKQAQQKLAEQKLAEQKLAEQKIQQQKVAQQVADQQKLEQQKKQQALKQLIAQQAQNEIKTESARALNSSRQAELASKQAAEQSNMRADFQDKIKAKIRSKIILPDGLQGNPQARFAVSVLPTGDVVKVTLRQPSGQPAYDNAVERAIYKASPLPMPPDAALVNEFRDLDLKFSPNEN